MLLAVLLCWLLTVHSTVALNQKQYEATKKLVRNTCQNKAKASNEEVEDMYKGNFFKTKNAQCYLYCVLSTYKVIRKDNSFDWEAGIKAVTANVPEALAVPGCKTMEKCKDAVKTSDDKCVAATEICDCMYKDNPGNSTYVPEEVLNKDESLVQYKRV